MTASNGQAEHYDRILADYEKHYYDAEAMKYRRRYIYPLLFHGCALNGKTVYELACGSGYNTLELLRLFPSAKVSGLDISPLSCEAYQKKTGRQALTVDLTKSEASLPEPADAAFVVGGLHHCVNDLDSTMRNLRRLVRPGGWLFMVEPNAAFFLNRLRTFWYKKDHWFHEQEEAPLLHDDLAAFAKRDFTPARVTYLGGPAYFLILNSLILRLPLTAKKFIAPASSFLDDIYNRLPGSAPFPMFIAQWRRNNND